MPDSSSTAKTTLKSKEQRFSKSLDQQSAKNIKATEFPPRKRSIPLGFEFDLDEVWGPSSPMLKNVYKERGLESSSSGSSDNSLGASHRRMSQGKRSTSATNNRTISEDSSEEFAIDDENVFQKIESLAKTLEDHKMKESESGLNSDPSSDLGSGLPSAKTLRGGQNVVARGRHSTYDRSPSSNTLAHSKPGSAPLSLYSTSSRGSSVGGSGRYDGAVSPLQSPRRHNNQLTPGLGGEVNRRNRRNRQMEEQRSMSVSPNMRN